MRGAEVLTVTLLLVAVSCSDRQVTEHYYNHPSLYSVSLPAEGGFTKARWTADTGNLESPKYSRMDVKIGVAPDGKVSVDFEVGLALRFTDSDPTDVWEANWDVTVLKRSGNSWEYKGHIGPLWRVFSLDSEHRSGELAASLSSNWNSLFELGAYYTCFVDLNGIKARGKASLWDARVATITIDLRSLRR
ncbi:MAG: hypothetical protein H6617_05085 [Bdellovibrionaceae bacterium]|nr:hypothetical protein [Bdellovibrionales bacterium]MCB9254038.1 hypothetical protein [Pseudobdellovibrionaceae bacterium]